MQKHFLYFCTFCNSSPAGPNRVLFLFPAKYEQKPSERATKRSIDRATDRSSDSATSFFKLFFHLATHSGHPYNYPMQRASDKAIEQVISYRPLPLDGLAGYREANRIPTLAAVESTSSITGTLKRWLQPLAIINFSLAFLATFRRRAAVSGIAA